MLENYITKHKMSKIITRKSKTKEKGEGQLGVADVNPYELNVRKTRHGTYPAPGTPTGTTWKLQLQRFRDKKEERSPSSNVVSSSTEAMDSDEAQRATAAIVQKLVKKQAEEVITEEPPSLADERETLMTKDQIDQKLAKKREDRKSSSSESGEVDLNDSIVTFKSAVSETNEVSRAALSEELDDTVRWEGDTSKRPPMEEEDEDVTENTLVTDNTNIEKLVKIKPVPKMTYISSEGTSKDDPIKRKEEGVINKMETGKTTGGKDKGKETEEQPPLQVEPTCDFYLPLMGNPKVADFPTKRKENTPMGGSVGRVIEVPFWEDMFGTRYFGVDIKYGLVYTIKNGKWDKLIQRCNTFPQEQYEFKDVSPKTTEGGVTSPRELDTLHTLQSKIGVPVAESTRKPKFQRVKIKDLGASYSDLNTLDFSDSTITSSEETEQINKEIEATESARQALEKERAVIEKEKMKVIRQQYEITKTRLKAAKKRRRKVLQAIKEEGIELEKQKKLTSDIRKRKREKLRQRMLEQLKLEESVCDEYLEYLKQEDADSDYLTEVSTLQEEQKTPEVGKEVMLVALIAKQLQMEDNMMRCRKLYEIKVKENPDNLKLINQQYEEENRRWKFN